MAISIADSVLGRNESISDVVEGLRQDIANLRGVFGGKVLFGSATYDAASLVDGAGATTSVTVTGAALGDFVLVSFSLDLQDISVTAYVSAADTVEVRFQNEGAATVDLASGTIRALVIGAPAVGAGLTVLPAAKVSA